MKASANGHSDVVQLLISAGARLNEKDYVSTSLLYYIYILFNGVECNMVGYCTSGCVIFSRAEGE